MRMRCALCDYHVPMHVDPSIEKITEKNVKWLSLWDGYDSASGEGIATDFVHCSWFSGA